MQVMCVCFCNDECSIRFSVFYISLDAMNIELTVVDGYKNKCLEVVLLFKI